MRRWSSRAAYPVVTLGAAVAAWWMVTHGIRGDLAVGCVFLGLVVILQLLERLLPYERAWNEPKGDAVTDMLHFLVSTLGVHFLFQAMTTRGWLSLGPPFGWPHQWPFVAQVLLALALGELGAYWVHRWMHSARLLWRLHRIHHSAPRLYAANASRNHPLDSLLILAAFALPLLWLGAGADVLAATAAFAIAHLALQHSNVELRLGALNWLVAGPELHRWHHSRVEAEANTNYGHVLSVWDALFGTRRLETNLRPPVDVGLFEGEVPASFTGQLVAAFAPDEAAR